jgi:hypothetical protein
MGAGPGKPSDNSYWQFPINRENLARPLAGIIAINKLFQKSKRHACL